VTQSSTIEVPAETNILQYTAEFILEKFSRNSADLSKLFVLLPHSQLTQPFNETLCGALTTELSAIIPPWSGTLKSWVNKFATNEHPDYQIIGEHARHLLFIEALQQHPDLFKEENKWQVTQALLSFFDELSLNQNDIFSSAEALQNKLQQAYGMDDPHQHMLYESKLVYTLWHAWQQQLDENKLLDETADYVSHLKNAAAAIDLQHDESQGQAPSGLPPIVQARSQPKSQKFICLGFSYYAKAEQQFIQKLIDNGQCHVINYKDTLLTENSVGQATDDSVSNSSSRHAFSSFISETYRQSTDSIKQRAQRFAGSLNAEKNHECFELFSTAPPFSVYLANDEEQQIRAIDYYIRSSILNGASNIAVISEDRKLSRRLRALLERANVPLQDKAGWSLATTQAASIIERWLECIEEDFSAYPLLDCLKSSYVKIDGICASDKDATSSSAKDKTQEENYRKNIYRFEHDLIFHENISSNISRYKKQLKNRLKRLSHWPENAYDELIEILNFIEHTAQALTEHYSADKKISLSVFLEALLNSLEKLGVLQYYQDDAAGFVLLQTFEQLKQSLKHADPELSWHDCRIFLGLALESQNFTPATDRSNIQLMTLEQAAYLNFDRLIIAACEPQHFPGSAKSSPLFNQAVRASLGLSTWEIQRKQRHELFNQTLLAAPEILLTACAEEKGEKKPVSPWLELLMNFYQLAFDRSTENHYINRLVLSQSEVFNCDQSELPEPSERPAPAVPDDIIPEKISASAYQRLINCPYQYFSADGLRLTALEELSDELKKSGYGERIHFILQIFHNGHSKFGNAFSATITGSNRQQAENYLAEISAKVFHSDLENNVLHRSWLHRWQKHIPSYINWQIQHQLDWNIYLCEEKLETTIQDTAGNSLTIYGRLDRIDINKENQSHAIIDYKTGRTARQDDVDKGENIQLSVYAMLDNQASEVGYLSVDSSYQKVESKSSLSDESLETNREQNKQRLLELFTQIRDREVLTAWGDDTVCCYCNFSGLCRKPEWTG
jgi:ATP-dependent helicase/nuclease subunit B